MSEIMKAFSSRLSRRTFLAGLGATVALPILAACQPEMVEVEKIVEKEVTRIVEKPVDIEKEVTRLVEQPVPEKVTIRVAHVWDAAFFKRQVEFDEFFLQRHPEFTIERELTPWGEHHQKYLTQIVGGAGPDLMYAVGFWVQRFICANAFAPLDNYFKDTANFNVADFVEAVWPNYQKEGKTWAIPYDNPAEFMLIYNTEIFDKGGVKHPDESWTFEDFRDAAKALTIPGEQWGYLSMPGMNQKLHRGILRPWGGGTVTEDQKKSLLGTPESIQAMQFWADLMVKDKVLPTPAERAGFPQGLNGFLAKRVAMAGGATHWHLSATQHGVPYNVGPWPKGPVRRETGIGGSGFGMGQTSKVKDQTWLYLNEYLGTAGQIFMWGTTGRGSPSRRSAYDSYKKVTGIAKDSQRYFDALEGYAKINLPYISRAPQAFEAAKGEWDLVVLGKKTAAEAGPVMAKAMDAVLSPPGDC